MKLAAALARAWRAGTESDALVPLRRWFRSKLLHWLGYDFDRSLPLKGPPIFDPPGSIANLAGILDRTARERTSIGLLIETSYRRVPEVEPGTIRIVIEVCR